MPNLALLPLLLAAVDADDHTSPLHTQEFLYSLHPSPNSLAFCHSMYLDGQNNGTGHSGLVVFSSLLTPKIQK